MENFKKLDLNLLNIATLKDIKDVLTRHQKYELASYVREAQRVKEKKLFRDFFNKLSKDQIADIILERVNKDSIINLIEDYENNKR